PRPARVMRGPGAFSEELKVDANRHGTSTASVLASSISRAISDQEIANVFFPESPEDKPRPGRRAMTAPHNQSDLFPQSAPAPSPPGMLVELDRTSDRELPCHDNLAFVCATKTMHAAELRCCTCDAHRGWLSKDAHNFITTTAARFGAPAEPLTLRD